MRVIIFVRSIAIKAFNSAGSDVSYRNLRLLRGGFLYKFTACVSRHYMIYIGNEQSDCALSVSYSMTLGLKGALDPDTIA